MRAAGKGRATEILVRLGAVIVWTLALFLWLLLQPSDVVAQGGLPPATGTTGVAGELRTVNGRVLSGSSDTLRPVPAQMVVLHRISADSSGPVDSMPTTANGAYRFRYRLEGPRSMYIVSARYAGVAYFTTPLRDATVTSPDADISVYDTTSAVFPLTIRARHLVITPPEGGVRRVVDVFEVANDSSRTLVPGTAGMTWRVALPPDARNPGSSGGDLPPEAFRFSPGMAELVVPFPPGSRQLVLTYAIPARGSTTIPVLDPTATIEVLVEDPQARVSGAGLTAEEQVSMEGRTFQRFTASTVAAGTAISLRGTGGTGNAGRVALLAIAVAAIALGIIIGRRGTPAPVAPPVVRATSESLAREIAALDHVYADSPADGPAGEHYRTRRSALLERLVDAQAVEEREPAT